MKSFFLYLGLFLSLGTTFTLGIVYFQNRGAPQDKAQISENPSEDFCPASQTHAEPLTPPPHAEFIYSWTSKLNADTPKRRVHVEPTLVWTEDFDLLEEDIFYDFLDELLEKNLIQAISLPLDFPKKTRQEWLEFGIPAHLLKPKKGIKRVEIILK